MCRGTISLLTGQYKKFASEFARPNRLGVRDASPPEVGNMIFFQDPNAALFPYLGAAFALTLPPTSPKFPSDAAPQGQSVQDAGDMAVYKMEGYPRAALWLSIPNNSAVSRVDWREDGPTRVTLETEAYFRRHSGTR